MEMAVIVDTNVTIPPWNVVSFAVDDEDES
jgi:hypothetical protein